MLLALRAGWASHVSVVPCAGRLCGEGLGPTSHEGTRPQKEFNNGARLFIGGRVAKGLVQRGEWDEVTHLVECQVQFEHETPQATAFLSHLPGVSA